MRVCWFIIILFLVGCDGRYSNIYDTTRYTYINNSNHQLDFIAFFNSENGSKIERFELAQEEQISFERYLDHWTGPLERAYFVSADSIITIFDDTLAISYNEGRLDGNPMRLDNYELLEGETDPYIYLFEFTDDDYERALERGRIIVAGEYD